MSKVLALKYRPKTFQDIIGQEAVSNTLSLSLENKRLSHAYLFSGLRGSGKTSTARIFSKSLMCDNGPTATPCEVCENCRMSNDNRHIDIIEMDAASNRGIDDIKDLQEQTRYKPSIGRYKIFIIDEVHMLTPQAFNALLKTLEEPPEFVKFILATTDPLKLPATILSRTQHFRFKKIAHNKIVHHIEHLLHLENITYDKNALDIIARSGQGSLRDTLTLLEQAITYSKGKIDVLSVTEMLGLLDPNVIQAILDAIIDKDKQKVLEYVNMLSEYESEMVIDELIAYLKDRLLEDDNQFSLMLLERFFRILSDAKQLLNINSDATFVLALMFFKMLEATKLKTIDEMISSINVPLSSTPKQKVQTTQSIEPTKEVIVEEEKVEEVVFAEPQRVDDRFEILGKKLYERNYDIGECFKNSIFFGSFEGNTLSWSSRADGECKKMLAQNYPIIKQIVYEVYGADTQIELVTEPKNEPVITEESDILNHPIVQKADELFGVSGIVVKPK